MDYDEIDFKNEFNNLIPYTTLEIPEDGFHVSTGTCLFGIDEPMYLALTEFVEDFTIYADYEIVIKELEKFSPAALFEWFMSMIDNQLYKPHERVRLKGLKWDDPEVNQILCRMLSTLKFLV